MKKLIAVAALLVAGSAWAFHVRSLTGSVFDPSGTATITTGKVVVTPTGPLTGTVADGQLVPVPETYPVVSGVITCAAPPCTIVAPANYKVELYKTTNSIDALVMTFPASVADVSGVITFTELYASGASAVTVAPGYALIGADIATFGSGTATTGTVLTATGSGGTSWTNPAGTGTISSVTAGTGLTGGGTSGGVTLNLAATAVTPGTYGVTTGYALGITVDQHGRITSASQRALGEGDITSLTSDLAARALLASPTFSGTVHGAFAGTFAGPLTGLASTATALAATPAQCASNRYATGITAAGVSNCAQVTFVQLGGTAAWAQLSKTSSNVADIGSGNATAGYVATSDGNHGTTWSAPSFAPPIGTGFMHVTSSAMDANAKTVSNADVASNAAIDWTKVDKAGAVAGDVGAATSAHGLSSASGTAPLTLSFAANALSGSVASATAGALGVIKLTGDLGGTAASPSVATIGNSTAANLHLAELLANAATASNTASTIVKRDSSGNFAAGIVTATSFVGALVGNASTVTNGLYNTGTYSNPAWLTSLAGSKITGAVANATASADGLSSASGTPPLTLTLAAKGLTGSIAVTPTNGGGAVALQASTPGTQQTGSLNLSGTVKAGAVVGPLTGAVTGNVTGNLTGNVTGNADTATNGLVSTGTYSNPSWLTAVAASKLTGYVGLAHGGTNADFSATGGTGKVLKQTSTGATITVAAVTDAELSTSDVTTNDVSATKHGFAPRAPNDATQLLRGDGTWSPMWSVQASPGNGAAWGLALLAQTAAVSLSAGQVVYLNADGFWFPAQADASATSSGLLGIAPVAIGSGATGVILLWGVVEKTGWALTKGQNYLLSPTVAGGLTTPAGITTTGQQIRAVGTALSATALFVNIGPDSGEHS